MRSLARYAVTNAVTRAMLSELLTKEGFEALARCSSLEDAWNTLRKTAYGNWVPEDVRVEPLAIEKTLRETTALRFKRAIRMLKGKPADVGALLLSRWELDNLEFALRLWHGKDPSLEALLSFPLFVHQIPLIEIIGAQTIDEIALALRHTPYCEPIYSATKDYKEKQSIFYVELALERDYYRRLLDAIAALGGNDAREGTQIVASEIDLLNLSWLARLVQYYDIQVPALSGVMIPGPSGISRQLASPDLTSTALEDLGGAFLTAHFNGEGRALSGLERVSMLEYMVSEMSVDTAKNLLARYPFSITGVFAFYLLKRVELRNLCTVFAGIASGLGQGEIASRLYGLR